MNKTPTERLVKLLKETGKNQPELADALPVSVSTISRWMSGETSHISKYKRELVANNLGLNLDYIEDGNNHHSQDHVNEPKVAYADLADLPEDGKLSRDQMKMFLGQIELIARTLKDSL